MNRGFTFIEVLVAMLIFVMAVVASISLTEGSVRATREAKQITVATWLLQNIMVELETKVETEGLDKGCEKKKEAKFAPPYESYSWTTYCSEIDFNLSQTSALVDKGKKEEDRDKKEDPIQKLILELAGKYITDSIRELHAEIQWMQGKTKRVIAATTHFARYDKPLPIPGGAAAPSGQGPGAPGTPSTPIQGGGTPH